MKRDIEENTQMRRFLLIAAAAAIALVGLSANSCGGSGNEEAAPAKPAEEMPAKPAEEMPAAPDDSAPDDAAPSDSDVQ